MKADIHPEHIVEVLHITDTHLDLNTSPSIPPKSFADAAAMFNGLTTEESLDQVLKHRACSNTDVVLHTGDLLEAPDSENYASALRTLARLEQPMLVCAGNHDDPAMLQTALDNSGLPQRCIDAGLWRIVVIDSNGGGSGGYVVERELEVLRDCALEWEGPVLLGLHHPPFSTCDHPECTIGNAKELLDVVYGVGNIRAVASGHLHDASDMERSGVRFLLGPSTCLQLKHTHPLEDHNRSSTKGGFRRIRLLPSGEVQSSLHWT